MSDQVSIEAKAEVCSADVTSAVSDTKVESTDQKIQPTPATASPTVNEKDAVADIVIPAAPDLDADTFHKLDYLLEQTKTFVRFIDDAHSAPAPPPADGEPSAKRARAADGSAIPSGDAATCAAAATAASAGAVAADLVAPSEQPKLVPLPIRRYQLAAVNWLESLYLNGFNGILADEMGLGKTVTTVSFFCRLWENKVTGPFLVVAPVSTLQNWMNEINKWSGGNIPAILYHGTKDQRNTLATTGRLAKCIQRSEQKKQAGEKAGCVVVTSFDIAMNDLKVLRRVAWQYVVVDEAHRLKNMHCKLIQDMRRLNTEYRLLLTGTPLQNNIAELWSLLNFILPAIFDDLAQFQRWFDFDSIVDDDHNPNGGEAEGCEGEGEDVDAASPSADKPDADGGDEKDKEREKEREKKKKTGGGWRSFAQQGSGGAPAATSGGKGAPMSRRTVLHSEQQTKILVKLHEILRPFMLRRLKSEVGLGLPSKREIALYCDATPAQQEAMKALMEGTFEDHINSIARARVGGAYSCARQRFSNVVMQLRKVCNHPFLFPQLNPFADQVLRTQAETAFDPGSDEDDLRHITSLGNRALRLVTTKDEVIDGMQWEDAAQRKEYDAALVAQCGKFRLLAQMLPSLHAAGHRVLIFSQMVSLLDLIEDHLLIHDYSFRRLDGSVPQMERQVRIEAFNHDPSIFCFLLSTRAGGLGVNLTGADTVIIYDSDWNPQMDLQAQDRAHRIGQTKPVAVYRLLTANSVESYLMHRATQKLRLEHLVIEKGNFNRSRKGKLFSAKDLEQVLQLRGGDGVVHLGDVAIDQETLKQVLDREYVVNMVNTHSRGEESGATEQTDLQVAAVAAGILASGEADAEEKALAALADADAKRGAQAKQKTGFEIVQDLSTGF